MKDAAFYELRGMIRALLTERPGLSTEQAMKLIRAAFVTNDWRADNEDLTRHWEELKATRLVSAPSN